MYTEEKNKQIVNQYVAAFNQGDLHTLQTLFAPEAVIQGVLGKGHMDKVMHIWEQLVSGLAMQLTIEEIITSGDLVAVRYTERGTFQGPFLGHAPTGKNYELVAMEWFVIRDGKIQQRWGARDHASQARQIGMPLS
ncbi:MAG: ester cyclase [Bacteroidota bacterium]|nr:ester cyclase [Bacteroidota bacterium]